MRGKRGLVLLVFLMIIMSFSVSGQTKSECNWDNGIWCDNLDECFTLDQLSSPASNLVCSISGNQIVYISSVDPGTPIYFQRLSFSSNTNFQFVDRSESPKSPWISDDQSGDANSLLHDGGTGGAGNNDGTTGGQGGNSYLLATSGERGQTVSQTSDDKTGRGYGGAGGYSGAEVSIYAGTLQLSGTATINVTGIKGGGGSGGVCVDGGFWYETKCSGGGGGGSGGGGGLIALFVGSLEGSGSLYVEARGGKGGKGGDGKAESGTGKDDGGGGGGGGGGDGGIVYFMYNTKSTSTNYYLRNYQGYGGAGGASADNAKAGTSGKSGSYDILNVHHPGTWVWGEDFGTAIIEVNFGSNACNDGLDNDGNGPIDMQDVSCSSDINICPDYESTISSNPSANDGTDGCCGDDNPLYSCEGTYYVACDEDPVGETCPSSECYLGNRCEGELTMYDFCDNMEYEYCNYGSYGCEVQGGECWPASGELGYETVLCNGFSMDMCDPDAEIGDYTNWCSYEDYCAGSISHSCTTFNNEESCDALIGCTWTLNNFILSEDKKDYASFTLDGEYLCSNDYDNDDQEMQLGYNDWHWWDADSEAYKIHTLDFCVPLSAIDTCETSCGTMSNGCGGTINCGGCEINDICDHNVCVECPFSCNTPPPRDYECGTFNFCGESTTCGPACPDYGTCVSGTCVACTDTCASEGWECSTVCGESCGTCEGNYYCDQGTCEMYANYCECEFGQPVFDTCESPLTALCDTQDDPDCYCCNSYYEDCTSAWGE